ncbi:hypothetical protein B9Z19DRAFT_1062608 [Tuber borchii]|uniref:ubiquitinyl hydrolase 1 n=1 Tax=Tuber borchii TaxID=42251 RepID=A0A2T7A164_TUBBO|nr:hypothetical protein B9Z19DRAFT_1062608 [Tuber borchii]
MGNVGSLLTAPPKVSPGTEIIIALMGVTGAGKSYFIREVSGNSAVEEEGTNKVQSYSFEYAGARITLVDTPGFNGMNRSDTKVLRMIGDWASEAYRNDQLLSGIIYLHPITHTRMEGSILKNLRTLQSLCGQEALENVLLTTTQWSRVNWVEGEFRENRLRIREFWGGLIEKGATLQRFAGTRASGLELIHKLMLNKPKPLHIQNQMVKQHMTLFETDAGKCINELLVGQKKKHKEEVESLSLEHQEAIKAKEDEMNEILAAEQAKALEVAAAEKELLAESHAAEVKQREAEERERREEATAYIKSLEKQLAVEQAKAQKKLEEVVAEKEFLVESHAAEVKKREAEESERQEEAEAKTKLLEEQLVAEIKKRQNEALGKCGLSNLGNTCYMNSALQCLRSVAELSNYFLSNKYTEELNPGNPLSHNGKVAKAYAALLGHIFSPTCPGSVSPREFKSTISRYSLSFSGYEQRNTREFLEFLLDGLHEDLNRIQEKPCIEKPESTDGMVGDSEAIAKLAQEHWSIYKQRNDSVIADLFGGLYQSTLVCPDCEKVSITFDPFMDLTLLLPVENVWGRDIYFFPSSASGKGLIKVPVEMDKNSSIKSLKEHFARKFNLDPKKTMASEVYKGKFFKHYEDFQTVSETIRQDDDAFIYELDDAPTNYPPSKGEKTRRAGVHEPSDAQFDDDDDVPDPGAPECDRLLVPVFNKVQKQNRYGIGSTAEVFGFPFFIVVNRDERRSFDAIMKKIIGKYQVLTTRNFYKSEASPNESETEEAVEVKDELEDMNETEEETDDRFVDVSMKDASSMVGSDRKTAKSPRRSLPTGIQDLFTVKVTKRRSGDSAVITGWQSLETGFDIRERLNREQSASPLLMWGEGLICEWSIEGYDSMFGGESKDDLRGVPLYNSVPLVQDQELERKRKGIHLEDCLDEFAKEVILSGEDPWFCPRCKVHRRASKKFELWKCPDILVIHLKRFSSSRNFEDKIDVLIDCPVASLNLQERVGLKEEGKSLVYDLIAVDNHYGGLGGGHYTAYAKSWIDNKWYHYDGLFTLILHFKTAKITDKFIDSSVREVNEQKVITSAAYLLFYRRRSETSLGGPRLNRILGESTNSPGSASSSRNTSPSRAGEGGLSGNSSATVLLNGRSPGGGTD